MPIIRMACNRDESRTRPAGLPPQERVFGARRAIMPIDPVSDGTWIAVNDAGLAMTLLNVYTPDAASRSAGGPAGAAATRSRGTIIPSLLHACTVAEAADNARALDPTQYPPFRLVMVDECGAIGDIRGGSGRIGAALGRLGGEPVLFTSSGLGDHLVEGPRRALFRESFTPDGEWTAQQERFHRHQWPDHPHLSVCMSRAEARTVSYTVVEITPQRVALTYLGDAPDRPVTPVTRYITRCAFAPPPA